MKNYVKLAYVAFLGMAMNVFNRIGGYINSQESVRGGHKTAKYLKTRKRDDRLYHAMKNAGKCYASTKGFAMKKPQAV